MSLGRLATRVLVLFLTVLAGASAAEHRAFWRPLAVVLWTTILLPLVLIALLVVLAAGRPRGRSVPS